VLLSRMVWLGLGPNVTCKLAPLWCPAGQRVIYFLNSLHYGDAGQSEEAVVGETDAGAGG
jgi:hypothetical protein